MCYNLCVMRTTLQTAIAFCLISTVACAAVAPHAKSEKKACAAAKSDLDADTAKIVQRMKAMVLPEIAFAPPQTMVDAVEFFRTASKKNDSAEIPEDKRGFNFILRGGIVSEDGETVECPTLLVFNAKKISFYDALKAICDSVGYTFEVYTFEGYDPIIVVKPKEDEVKPQSEEKACAAAKSDLDADAAEIVQRMKAIVLPEIAFAPPQTMVDAVEFLRTASKKYDSAEIPEDKRGFSFVLKGIVSEDGGTVEYPTLPEGGFNAKRIPLYDALEVLCDAVDYTFEVCNSIIVVKPLEHILPSTWASWATTP